VVRMAKCTEKSSPRAHRDALKLLAVFLQHTDSKPEQQRVVCLPSQRVRTRGSCGLPFLMINDVGLTFGRANRTNAADTGSVNLVAWRETPVWSACAIRRMFHRDSPRLTNGSPHSSRSARKSCSVAAHSACRAVMHPPGLLFLDALAVGSVPVCIHPA